MGIGLAGCSSISISSNDPSQPFYKNPALNCKDYDRICIDIVNVETSNQQGIELVRSTFFNSLKAYLYRSGLFKDITGKEGLSAKGKILHLKADIKVNWGNRALRGLVGFGAGSASILINYHLFEKGKDTLLAKMEARDTMSGTGWAWGGNAKYLVYNAAKKWNAFFVTRVLQ